VSPVFPKYFPNIRTHEYQVKQHNYIVKHFVSSEYGKRDFFCGGSGSDGVVMEEEDRRLIAAEASFPRGEAEGRRWLDEEPSEPREVSDRRPAKFYAPAGECEYCDRRRAASARSMRESRERGGDA
jgi:hypothetical protein